MDALPLSSRGLLGGVLQSIIRTTASSAYQSDSVPASRPSMARFRLATVMGAVCMISSTLAQAGSPRWGLLPRGLADGLGLLGRHLQYRVGLLLERGEVDLHAVEHSAPVARDRRHGHGLAHLLVGRAVRLGGSGVEIDAIEARDLR